MILALLNTSHVKELGEMRKFTYFVSFAVIVGHVAASEQNLGDFELLPGMIFRYTYWSTDVKYAEAEQRCMDSDQGHLTSILSKEELEYLTDAIKKLDNGPSSVWIGELESLYGNKGLEGRSHIRSPKVHKPESEKNV